MYFSAHLFDSPTPRKSAVLPTRTIQADLDGADVYSLPIPPSVLLKTSEARHQAWWILKDTASSGLLIPNDILEELSRRLTYSIPDCDRTGWPLGKRLRFPGTINFKYPVPQPVEIITLGARKIDPATLDTLPEVDPKFTPAVEEWVDLPHSASVLTDLPPMETILTLQKAGGISSTARSQYANPAKDRSTALWRLMCELFAAGLNREAVYWLAFNSRNNKFADRRYGATRDLRKDVMRAESAVLTKGVSIREDIEKIKATTGIDRETKFLKIAEAIQRYMQSRGSFVHTVDDESYFIRSDQGKPIPVGTMSNNFAAYLTIEVGINSATETYRYVLHYLRAYTEMLPAEVEVAALSYFDLENRVLSLHTGKKDIVMVTPESIFTAPNGSSDIMFKWSRMIEPFTVNFDPLPNDEKWYDLMFDSGLDYVLNLTKPQAKALLAVITIYTLMRANLTRPVLAMFGRPGSGKSTLMRMLYRLLYGRTRELNYLTTDKDFEHATTHNPFVCFDNADTWQKWLPDMLATSIGNTSSERRRLFTDKETVEFRRQAVVAMTAHSPKFIREDIADRLLVFQLDRRPHFTDEKQILSRVTHFRPQLWGAIVRDLQKTLTLPLPTDSEVPQFRMQDFATYGLWIARGIGLGDDFCSAIVRIRGSQTQLVIEGDHSLISAIDTMIASRQRAKGAVNFMSTTELFQRLSEASDDKLVFIRKYKNAGQLGQKMWTAAEALKSRYRLEFQIDQNTGTRRWLIDKLSNS